MDVILLERVAKLGQMGDVVRVKNGYGRNFLLPAGKALRATEDNRRIFEHRRPEISNCARKPKRLPKPSPDASSPLSGLPPEPAHCMARSVPAISGKRPLPMA